MLRLIWTTSLILISIAVLDAQVSRSSRRTTTSAEKGSPATVIDQRLAVIRKEPSLYAEPVKRLEIGDEITVYEEKEADGVAFFRVTDSTTIAGWLQSEAFAGTFRKNDDMRLARLILGSDGDIQLQRTAVFVNVFKDSPNRPWVLLLFGDIVETKADELSGMATENLDEQEMGAAQAPMHSFYLNFPALDKYRALGIRFLFNAKTKRLHYNGDSWFEITRRFPESEESIEARERIRSLTAKMKAEE